ncbi:MAG: cytochrome c biogenesis protein CcdA [Elusimicrobia bacterium]|nr:cytochrome c biogenesis protein CcdA [Elusimicrobiota bacterium]
METIGKFPLIASFLAGIMTFLSPCILPLIPAYLFYITGISLEELRKEEKSITKVFLNSVFFVFGFSVIFILLGISASFLGNIVVSGKNIIRFVGGGVVIIFGLHITGIFTIPFLYFQKNIKISRVSVGYFGSFLIGVAFAMGWTPCIGPILSSILILASTQGTVFKGTLLLIFYSIGIAIPFLLTALFINWSLSVFEKIKKYFRVIEIISGIILIIVGILIITDNFNRLTILFIRIFS